MAKIKKVLIAEDEKPMAKALEIKLNKSGFEARAVNNGEEAIKALTSEKFDFFMTDLIMPKKNGFEVLEEMQNKGIKVPTIVLSNLGQNEDIERVKKLGALDFLIKSSTPIIEIVNYLKNFK